jgi:hypothetical protein
MKTLKLLLPAVLLLIIGSCSDITPKNQKTTFNHDILSECNLAIQNAVVLDGVTPPVASRRYFYSCVSAYEAIKPFFGDLNSVSGQFTDFETLSNCDTSKGYCLDLVAMESYTQTAMKLVYKEDSIASFRERKLDFYKSQLPEDVYNRSLEWGQKVSNHVVKWSKGDTFNQIRGTDLYMANESEAFWQPTPTEYMEAIEPQWRKIRPNLIESCNQFRDTLPVPTPYNMGKNPDFYPLMKEIHDAVVNIDSNQLRIARYWDDNPKSTFHYGHATLKVLKVSPAGHWLSMFSTVARKEQYSLNESAEGMLRLSAVMFDAFIAVWDAKYHYEYIRPVTVIRRHMDSSWLPAIETPAFPEYPSAHSVVSSAAATVLTDLFGEYSFTDSAEFEFGLGVRTFKNFREASDEACMSRIYGGIHFREGMEYGKYLGNTIGAYHNDKLITRQSEKD